MSKKKNNKFTFWSVAPFFIFVAILLVLFLINDGYKVFQNLGWNPIYIVGLRKIYYIATAVIAGLVSYVLIKFYRNIVSDWKKGRMYSSFYKPIEVIIVTIFILGPALLGIYLIVHTFLIFIGVNDSYLEGIWNLRFRK